MRAVVTGSAGFIGSHLSEALLQRGDEVVGIDSLSDHYSRALKQANVEAITAAGATFHQLDLSDPSLPDIVAGADAVFHLAAQPGISDAVSYSAYIRNNLDATEQLLRAVRGTDMGAFVYISSSSVYGSDATVAEDAEVKPTSYYGVTKHGGEQLVLAANREDGLPACSMRLYSVCGPRERPEKLFPKLIRHLLFGDRFTLYEGSEAHRRSFTHVADIVDGLIGAVDHWDAANGQIFNLGNELDHTTGEGIEIVSQLIGKRPSPELYPPRRGDQQQTRAVIDKARAAFGYGPKRTLEDALADEVAWFRDQPA